MGNLDTTPQINHTEGIRSRFSVLSTPLIFAAVIGGLISRLCQSLGGDVKG